MEGLSCYGNTNDKAKYHGNSKIDRNAGIFHEITDGKHFEFLTGICGKSSHLANALAQCMEVLSGFCFDQHKRH